MANGRPPPKTDRAFLAREYRELEACLKRDKGLASGNQDNSLIHDNLQKADQLHVFAQKPQEHAKDAGFFERLVETHAEQAQKLAANQQGRTIIDLICALRATYVRGDDPQVAGQEDPSAFDWLKLGTDANQLYRMAPGVNCMLGPLDAQPKAQKPRQARQKRQIAEVSRPDELQSIVESEKQETDRNMEEMWNVLMKGESPVAELVCNHQSFSQTVENLFTLAFLVRDGKVQLLHDPETGMIARKVLKGQKQQLQQQQAGSSRGARSVEEQRQFVIALTQEHWVDMTHMVRKEDCRMKHRHQEGLKSQAVPASQGQARHSSQVPCNNTQVPNYQATQTAGLASVKQEGNSSKRRQLL